MGRKKVNVKAEKIKGMGKSLEDYDPPGRPQVPDDRLGAGQIIIPLAPSRVQTAEGKTAWRIRALEGDRVHLWATPYGLPAPFRRVVISQILDWHLRGEILILWSACGCQRRLCYLAKKSIMLSTIPQSTRVVFAESILAPLPSKVPEEQQTPRAPVDF